MAKMYCQKCGCELKEDEVVCPKCGLRAGALVDMNEYVEVKKPKKNYVFMVIAVIVVLGLIYSFFIGGDSGKYRSNLYDACLILDQAEEVEKDINLMLNTWKNEDKDAVTELYASEDFRERLDVVRANRDKLTELKGSFSDPPKELKNFKEPMQTSIDAYIEYTDILLNPEGSYSSVKKEAEEKSKAFFDAYIQL